MKITAAFSGYSSGDIEADKLFYANILGLELIDEMDGFAFECQGQRVFVYPKADHAPATFTVLNFVVADIEAAITELREADVEMQRYDNLPATQDEFGVLRGKAVDMGPNIAWFQDPSGNVLSLVEE